MKNPKNKELLKSASTEELYELEKELASEIRSRSLGNKEKPNIVTFTDGASRGNPGPAGVGVLLLMRKTKKLKRIFGTSGPVRTTKPNIARSFWP